MSETKTATPPTETAFDAYESVIVEIVEGPGKGKRHPLGPGRNVLGRLPDAAVQLEGNEISRHHVAITIDEDIQIEDLGSAVGTSLNGRLLLGQDFLFDNDEFRIGPYLMRIEVKRRENPRGILWGLGFLAVALLIFLAALFFPESSYAENAAEAAARSDRDSTLSRWRDWESLILPSTEALEADGIAITPASALEQYEFGTRLYQDRLSDLGNPYQALLYYKRTLAILTRLEQPQQRPAVANRCLSRIQELQQMIRRECRERIFSARKNAKLKWWRQAAQSVGDVRRICPWVGCRYNRWARRQLSQWRRLGVI